MDALTAPRAFRKTESLSQKTMRGLGIEENDSKNNLDAAPPHHHEAAKPRGKLQNIEIEQRSILTPFCFYRGNEVRSNYLGDSET